MPLEIRIVSDSEYRAVNDFFNNTRNINVPAKKTPRGYPEFCWEFIDGPAGKAIYAAAWEVEAGKEPVIVGIQGLIPLKMIASDGATFLTAKGEDTLIDIKALIRYKETDILRELYLVLFEECRKRGIKQVWGFNSTYATNQRLGFELPVRSHYCALVLDPLRTYQNNVSQKTGIQFSEKGKILGQALLSRLYSLRKFFIPSSIGNYRFNTGMDDNRELFQRAAGPEPYFFLCQESTYFKWRITENPYPVKYRSFQLSDPSNVFKAQLICSIHEGAAFIEQLLFEQGTEKSALYSLLKRAIRSLKEEKVYMIRYIGFDSNALNKKEMKMLRDLGFVKTKKGEQFNFLNLSDDLIIKPENVYLSRLYKQGIN